MTLPASRVTEFRRLYRCMIITVILCEGFVGIDSRENRCEVLPVFAFRNTLPFFLCLFSKALLPVLSPLSIQVSVIGIGQGEHCIIPEIYFCHQEHPFVFPYVLISPSSFHRGVFHLLCHGPLMVPELFNY
jgi:hypothetical protein